MIKKTRKGVYLRGAANTASALTGMQFCGARRKKAQIWHRLAASGRIF
ncbi:hypothetical protein SFK218_5050 [Shigella flexneri K-218]|nr:hypothetical protein SFK218_5050 [Shigella flexneri K-218]EHV52318.1 hypothetical protein ECDEC6A_4399 [Escherichia coli DEC6A]EIO71977.1 hypothetical protein ECTW09109_5174 [Escherichia coli TW09109]ELV52780.1 hypothetical protein EC991793_4628 [Escherichia coli 99.1793]